jgi:hypothetical protein
MTGALKTPPAKALLMRLHQQLTSKNIDLKFTPWRWNAIVTDIRSVIITGEGLFSVRVAVQRSSDRARGAGSAG